MADLTPNVLSINEVEGADFEGRGWQDGVFGPGNGDTLVYFDRVGEAGRAKLACVGRENVTMGQLQWE